MRGEATPLDLGNSLASSSSSACGAKTRIGHPCKNAPMSNGRCRMHGGKSLSGIASPTLRNGRRSKYLPGPLNEKVEQARRDPDLLNLREEIALIDGLIAEASERIDSGESDEVWAGLVRISTQLKKAAATQDMEKLFAASTECTDLIERGIAVRSAMQNVVGYIEQRRKLVESEAKRLERMHQMARYEEVALFVRRVFTSIREHVSDKEALDRIANDLAPLMRSEANR